MTAEESDDTVTNAIERRRRAVEAEWKISVRWSSCAGHPIRFRDAPIVSTHSWPTAIIYLTDRQRAGSVLAYDPRKDGAISCRHQRG